MSDISPGLRAEVVLRAGNRCEYCKLSQLGQEGCSTREGTFGRNTSAGQQNGSCR